MKIFLTGSSSGIGKELNQQLVDLGHTVVAPKREELNLSDISKTINYPIGEVDMLINCAATGVGGKIDFCNHNIADVVDILNTNVMSPVILCHSALNKNINCKIVNITSTNNNRYWPNDLAYSLSKKSLEDLGLMLQIEYPALNYLEIRLGLTKTNFNQNRYIKEPNRFTNIYDTNRYQTVNKTVKTIVNVLFDPNVKFIEISP